MKEFREHGENTITRDTAGNPTATISPYGHRTSLKADGENNLTDIDFEDGTGYSFGYTRFGVILEISIFS